MARNGGAWRRLMESTEGPTVTVALPREWAEELLQSLAASLEMGDGLDGDMDDPDAGMDLDMDMDSGPDMGDDDMGMGPGMDGDDGGELDFAAGEPDDDEPPAPPKKKGPGRPPGSKSKKKDAPKSKEKPKDDSDDDEEKDENVDFSAGPTDGFSPGTAFGESAYARAAGLISEFRRVGRRRPAVRRK